MFEPLHHSTLHTPSSCPCPYISSRGDFPCFQSSQFVSECCGRTIIPQLSNKTKRFFCSLCKLLKLSDEELQRFSLNLRNAKRVILFSLTLSYEMQVETFLNYGVAYLIKILCVIQPIFGFTSFGRKFKFHKIQNQPKSV